MTYYQHFRGEYDSAHEAINERRQAIIDSARQLQPDNVDELLKASVDGELYHELEWAEVPNPLKLSEADTITVRPVLGIALGNEDAEREKDRYDKGVWQLGIEAKLPSGEIWYLGDIYFFHLNGKLKYEPGIGLNASPAGHHWARPFDWDSVDAELFMNLAESALSAQTE